MESNPVKVKTTAAKAPLNFTAENFGGVVFTVVWVVLLIVAVVGAMISDVLGVLMWIINVLLFLAFFVAMFGGLIYAAYKAYQGQMFKLPIVGNLAEKIVK